MSFVNWQDFEATQRTQNEQQAEANEMMSRQQRDVMDKALASLGDAASDQARSGTFRDMSQFAGYSGLMAQRDAALQANAPKQQVAPWEAELQRPEFKSPWEELNKRLGSANNKYAQRNTETLNRQAAEKRAAELAAFKKSQQDALAAANAGKNKATDDYVKWSNSVLYNSQNNRGPGAGAYYDAAQGTGPQPVSAGYGPTVQGHQSWLRKNNQNQILPETTNSNFGQSTSGF